MGTTSEPDSGLRDSAVIFEALRAGQGAVWRNPSPAALVVTDGERARIEAAAQRFDRFAPLLRRLFPKGGWDGVIASELLDYAAPPAPLSTLLVKADHDLPMTGSIKARGGVYELLAFIEKVAHDEVLLEPGQGLETLLEPEAQAVLSLHSVAVASTGNLGYSVGLVARAVGLAAEIHVSSDAKPWKVARLRALDAKVVEHECNYTETVARARVASAGAARTHFIDDERSKDLFFGYAVAAAEIAAQLARRGLTPREDAPLVVYLPCGVGGAPGGVLFGLKALFGDAVVGVFVEPTESACMLAALATGSRVPVSVYDLGLHNATIADGLAVPQVSGMVLERIGPSIAAVVAVPDAEMLRWARHAHAANGLRLEPSAASALAAVSPFLASARADPMLSDRLDRGIHVVWTTGGASLPDEEFERVLTA
jgi:D-serine dehydratase